MENMYNLNIERSVIASIIFEPELFENVELNDYDFYLPFHQYAFRAIGELHKEEKPIEEEFIRSKLLKAGKFDEVAMLDLLSANPISNVAAYVSEIKAKSSKRALAALASEVKKVVIEDDLPADKVIELISGKLEDILSNTSTKTDTLEDFLAVYTQDKYLAEPKHLTPIEGGHGFFYDGGLHLVHGLSKAGKTYFVLEALNGVTSHKVLWLDGDNNDDSMKKAFTNIVHIPPLEPNAWLNRIIERKIDLKGCIIVLDSLKDYTNGENLDTNEGANNIMQHIKQLDRLGATVVIIAHSTPQLDKGGDKVKPKLKGNSEYLYANIDVTYMFERNFENGERTVTAERSRIPSMQTGYSTTFKQLTASNGNYMASSGEAL